MRSGTRFMGLPDLLTRIISSTYGLCKSKLLAVSFGLLAMFKASSAFLDSDFNSSILPIQTSSSPSSVFHIGKGVPQNLERLKFQSTIFSSQLPNLPSPVDFGFQLMVLFNSTILSLIAVVLINHASNG